MQKLTLQINDLSALERLIGGDSEVEIEVRHNIVDKFVKKHLKGIADSDLVTKAVNQVRNDVSKFIMEEVKTSGWWGTKSVLSANGEKLISDFIKTRFDEEVSKIVDQYLGANKIKERLEALLDRQSDYIVNVLTEKNIQTRLDHLVDQKIKEKLGL